MRHVLTVLLACVAICLNAHAHAQATPVLVRAGEHRDYTRLILELPDQNQWQLSKGTGSARLDIEGPPLEFDLTQTFARIPRTRLRDLRASQGGLDLYIACACDIQAREDIPQFLIIDIIGRGTHARFAPMTAPRPPKRPARLRPDRNGGTADPRRAGTQLAQALRRGTSDRVLPHALTLSGVIGTAPMIPEQPMNNDATIETSHRAVVAIELGHVLASAVSSGKLQATTDFTASIDSKHNHNGDPHHVEGDLDAHFSIQAQARTRPESTVSPALHCPDASFIDPSDWFAQTDPAKVAQNLGNLFNDFDQADPDHILKSAQHFILLGFGAEARMVLSLLPQLDAAAETLKGISYLVDMSPLPATIDFALLDSCGPMGSLWAFLASRDTALPAGTSIDNLVQALQTLPPHLRLHLGPEAVQRLAALGRREEAQVILTSLERIAHAESAQLNLARATLDLADARSDKAHILEGTLSPATYDDDLIFLLSRRDAQGNSLEASLLDAATTRLFALRGTPTGQEITRLLVRAAGRSGDFQQAFKMLDSRDAAFAENAIKPLRIELLTDLVTRAEDTSFITVMFEQRPWDLTYLPEALVTKLTARLRSLGFDRQAGLMERPAENEEWQGARSPAPSHLTMTGPTSARNAHILSVQDAEQQGHTDALPPQVPTSRSRASDISLDEADILRARAAQTQAQREGNSTAPTAPAPEPLATLTGAPDAEFQALSEPDQRDQNANSDTRGTEVTDAGAEPGMAILTQSRDALGQSAELRARLQSLLDDGIER